MATVEAELNIGDDVRCGRLGKTGVDLMDLVWLKECVSRESELKINVTLLSSKMENEN